MRFFSAESKPHNFSAFLMVRAVHCAVFGRFFKKIVRFCGFMRFSDTFKFRRAKNHVLVLLKLIMTSHHWGENEIHETKTDSLNFLAVPPRNGAANCEMFVSKNSKK